MPEIQVANPLYERARIRATEAGFASVDEYVAEMLREEMTISPNFDRLFTPERIAKLDQIVESMSNGQKVYTEAQVDAHFKTRRESWPGK